MSTHYKSKFANITRNNRKSACNILEVGMYLHLFVLLQGNYLNLLEVHIYFHFWNTVYDTYESVLPFSLSYSELKYSKRCSLLLKSSRHFCKASSSSWSGAGQNFKPLLTTFHSTLGKRFIQEVEHSRVNICLFSDFLTKVSWVMHGSNYQNCVIFTMFTYSIGQKGRGWLDLSFMQRGLLLRFM